MRVTLCVDALAPNPGGIGRYTWQLCQGLAQRADLDVRYFARNRFIEDPSALLRGESLPRRRFRRFRSWLSARQLRGGLFHATNYFLPPSIEGVVTIHDLSVFKYPETHPVERVRAFEGEFRSSLGRARHIITDTETVRGELIADFNVAPESVTAVHLGVEDRFRPQSAGSTGAALAPLGLQPSAYALCVSTLEPRKKIAELLSAWRELPAELRTAYPLVLAGGAGWLSEPLQADIGRGIAEGWLRSLGFVRDDMLPALYAGARLFIYPSIYEGFGLPPIEAMASGAPTIVASRSCLPEVCGEAARYVDPEDAQSLLSCIVESLSDVQWQAEAKRSGPRQASKYSWERCVEETVAVYRRIM